MFASKTPKHGYQCKQYLNLLIEYYNYCEWINFLRLGLVWVTSVNIFTHYFFRNFVAPLINDSATAPGVLLLC